MYQYIYEHWIIVSLRSLRAGEVCIINGSRHEDILHPSVGNVAHVSRLMPANVREASDDFTAIWAIWTNLKKTHIQLPYSVDHDRSTREVYNLW